MALKEIRHATDSFYATTYAGFTGEGMRFETQINSKKSIYSSLETACQQIEFQAIKRACVAGLGMGIVLTDLGICFLTSSNEMPIFIAAAVGTVLSGLGLIESRKRVQLRADIKACEYQLRENLTDSIRKIQNPNTPLRLAAKGYSFSLN